MTGTSPSDFGLADRFGTWRPNQFQTSRTIAFTSKKFTALNAPTGSGKSVAYLAPIGMMDPDARSCVVTSTTALQDQVGGDHLGLCDVRGQIHKRCVDLPHLSCRHGMAAGCGHMKTPTCPWTAQMRVMRRSDMVLTNYAAFLAYGTNMGHFDYLVLDEFHDAENWLTNQATVTLTVKFVYDMMATGYLEPGSSVQQWREWANSRLERANECLIRYKYAAERDITRMSDFMLACEGKQALEDLAKCDDSWCVEFGNDRVTLQPIDVRKYGSLLFRRSPRIVCSSATLTPKTLEVNGIDLDDVEWIKLPCAFTRDRFMVWYSPVTRITRNKKTKEDYEQAISWNRDSPEEDITLIMQRIADICERRTDRRGIVHSVSYTRAQQIAEYLRIRLGDRVVIYAPKRSQVKETIVEFITGPVNAIFVCPSVTTGYDFKFEAARYQIIPKMPWPDMTSAVVQARIAIDPDYAAHICGQNFSQTVGRINRDEKDWGETFIVDGSFGYFWRRFAGSCCPPYIADYLRWGWKGQWQYPIHRSQFPEVA